MNSTHNTKITILTSAYNAERTLERTMESVLYQTYADFEYIVIDHGSSDGTADIIRKHMKRDSRIRLLSLPENLGCPARALNIGMKEAKGEYLCFLDADDLYMRDFLKVMLETIERSNADVVACSRMDHYEDTELRRLLGTHYELSVGCFNKQYTFHDEEDYKEYWVNFLQSMEDGFILFDLYWNKIYKKAFLDKNRLIMPENSLYLADALFNDNVFSLYPKAVFLPYVGTVRKVDGRSVTWNFKWQRIQEMLMYITSKHRWVKLLKKDNSVKEIEWLLLKWICFPVEHWRTDTVGQQHINAVNQILQDETVRELARSIGNEAFVYVNNWAYEMIAYFQESIDNKSLHEVESMMLAGEIENNVKNRRDLFWNDKNLFSIGSLMREETAI